jgi:tRNA pseudouridine13 synthase
MERIFKFKCIPEDFLVREVPLFPQLYSKIKPVYTYIWLEKVGYTTFEAQQVIQRFFDLSPKDVSAQGLKDEDGITLQMLAVRKKLNKSDITNFNNQYSHSSTYFRIKEIWGYGKHSLTPGILHGNTFTVTIRALTAELTQKITESYRKNRYFSFVNYYDTQRFGLPNGPYNAHLIGESLVRGDWKLALAEFTRTKNMTSEMAAQLPATAFFEDCRSFFVNHVGEKLLSFFISSYNSKIWNESASNHLKKVPGLYTRLLPDSPVGELHIPTTSITDIPPLLSTEAFQWIEQGEAVPSIKTRPFVIHTSIYYANPESDELHPGRMKLSMSFFLPVGSYATMLLKQLECQFNQNG